MTQPPQIDVAEVYKAIGMLVAKVDALTDRHTESERRATEAERRSSENRSRLYEKIEDVGRRAHSLEQSNTRLEAAITSSNAEFKSWVKDFDDRLVRVEAVTKSHGERLNDYGPTIDLVGMWRQRVIGISFALMALGALFGVAVTNMKVAIWKALVGG